MSRETASLLFLYCVTISPSKMHSTVTLITDLIILYLCSMFSLILHLHHMLVVLQTIYLLILLVNIYLTRGHSLKN